jgi:hypothetical protein
MVSPSDVTVVDGPSGLRQLLADHFDTPIPGGVRSVVERRARGDAPFDHVVLLADWAYERWSDYQIARGPVMLVGSIEDYSEKSFFVEGAFEVDTDVMRSKPADEVDSASLTSLVHQVDETDEDFIDDVGATFLPKSAVDSIVVCD